MFISIVIPLPFPILISLPLPLPLPILISLSISGKSMSGKSTSGKSTSGSSFSPKTLTSAFLVLLPSAVETIICALPGATATTFPLPSTVATSGLSLVNTTSPGECNTLIV